jgi:hypothetical protein
MSRKIGKGSLRCRLPRKPPDPPLGYMWFFWKRVRITEVEQEARRRMDRFDRELRCVRDKTNYWEPNRIPSPLSGIKGPYKPEPANAPAAEPNIRRNFRHRNSGFRLGKADHEFYFGDLV